MSSRVIHPAQRTRRGDLRDRIEELVEQIPMAPQRLGSIIPTPEAREVDPDEYALEVNRAALREHLRPR